MKLISKIIFVTLLVSFSSITYANNEACSLAEGTNQRVCWRGAWLEGKPAKIQYPADGNYWHKMIGVNRKLSVVLANGDPGEQHTLYLGEDKLGHHKYRETLYIKNKPYKSLYIVLDGKSRVVQEIIKD